MLKTTTRLNNKNKNTIEKVGPQVLGHAGALLATIKARMGAIVFCWLHSGPPWVLQCFAGFTPGILGTTGHSGGALLATLWGPLGALAFCWLQAGHHCTLS
jgi:hypothetical protein